MCALTIIRVTTESDAKGNKGIKHGDGVMKVIKNKQRWACIHQRGKRFIINS